MNRRDPVTRDPVVRDPAALAAVALIPARAGSKRVPGKNVRVLAGHPLIAYTIAAARESGVFRTIVVSTDSESTADIARYYGADVPELRPAEIAGDLAPDIRWVEHMLGVLKARGQSYECFSILRPTSPFRSAETIRRAWREFISDPGVDSLRAVEPCKQHPGKMWVLRGERMLPLLPLSPEDVPWHSNQLQALPRVYVQNASLEIAHVRVVLEQHTIAGVTLRPFMTEGNEGFDINQPRDWELCESLLQHGQYTLPKVEKAPYRGPSP